MKTDEAEMWLTKELMSLYSEGENAAIAAWVFEKLTHSSRAERWTQRNEPLTAAQSQQLTTIARRLQQHEPVQYVLGEAYFYGLQLYVDNNVLIPRAETEELVEWILADLRATNLAVFSSDNTRADATRLLKILDVGTGSGCIALALKKSIPKAEVWGCDNSDETLTVARRNGATLDIRVDFQQVDFLDKAQWNGLPAIDIIVSNPPYIALTEKESMAPNVVNYEPHRALFVPDENPLLFYEALAHFGTQKLYPGGYLYIEVHETNGPLVVQLFQNQMYTDVQLKKDMQGKHRMIKARK